jgi:hypothetical protein
MNRLLLAFVAGMCLFCWSEPAHAWDAHGHRVVTLLALDAVKADAALPAWLNEPAARSRAAYQSAEPDRWRGQRTPALINENAMDHYIDIEDLADYGLSLATLPKLRSRGLAAMAQARAAHPERFTAYDASKDPNGDKEYPGFLPYAIMEHFAKLQASFRTLRLLEAVESDGGRANQIDQARANVIYHIGVLSHFVADTAQPLHTTRHFNGWVGPPEANPNGYTTSNKFHAYIDGGVVDLHKLTYDSLRPMLATDTVVNAADPWDDVIAMIERSYSHMEQLYKMEKDGSLNEAAGKALIEERLLDGAKVLGAMIRAAWATSEPDGMEIKRFSGWTPAE